MKNGLVSADKPEAMKAGSLSSVTSKEFRLSKTIVLSFAIALTTGWMFLSERTFFVRMPRTASRQGAVGLAIEVNGSAKLRTPFQLDWAPLRPGETLFEGDEIATLQSSTVKLQTPDGGTLTLEPGSVAVLRRTGSLRDSMRIMLLEGSIRKRENRIVVQNSKPVIIDSNSPDSDAPFATQAPLDARRTPAVENEKTSSLHPPRLLRPKLLNPESPEGTLRPNLNPPRLKGTKIRTLEDGARFFQKDRRTCWATKEKKVLEKLLDFLLPMAHADEDSLPDLANRAKLHSIELEWQSVEEASSYWVEIASDSNFSQLVFSQEVSIPKIVWTTRVPGLYYWRVATIDKDGAKSPPSEFMTFKIRSKRNVEGDETTYGTYIKFDEYSGSPHSFAIIMGSQLSKYSFSPDEKTASSGSVVYSQSTLFQRNPQFEYQYRISPHYSFLASLRSEKNSLNASNFEERPQQKWVSQKDTVITLGGERRFFLSDFHYVVRGGLRISYLNIPVPVPVPEQIKLDGLAFFGPYATGGIQKDLTKHLEASIHFGFLFQHSGDAYRIGQLGQMEMGYLLRSAFSVGLRFEEGYYFYGFGTDTISGQARLLMLRAAGILKFRF